METYPMYIGGEFREKEEKIMIENPATEEVFAQIPNADEEDLAFCLKRARLAQRQWESVPFKQRKELLLGISKVILENLRTLAELETKEIGKTIKETLFVDIPLSAQCFEYYASLLDTIHSPISLNQDNIDIIQYIPFGIAGVFLPYNVPLMTFGFTCAAALAAGNAIIVKPSEYGSLSLLELSKYIDDLDFPKGLINIITGEGPGIGRKLASSDIDIISFTGSNSNFRRLFQGMKPRKVICELGGANLAVVFSDADLEEAAENIVGSAFMKQGQMCIGTSIALIEEGIYRDFLKILIKKTEKIRLGDPLLPLTGMGPLRSRMHLDGLINKIEGLKKEGAKILIGGEKIKSRGYFYAPTIIEMEKLVYEEFFSPVLLVKAFKREEIKNLVSENPTGLVLQIWTRDIEMAKEMALDIHCGTVWINTFAQMDASTPFGGFKESGFGRTLGKWGLFEYLQPKHIATSFRKSPASGWFG